MLNRVFKTIFILTLCIGISLPANAGNVQVSEGSAFVTKSELSYELDNLSNRMTVLENSLDSRIDNLVSSYLTRNGIWSGARQTLSTTGFTNAFSTTNLYNTYKAGTYANLLSTIDGRTYDSYILVNSASKSGLVNMVANQYSTGLLIASIGTPHSGKLISGSTYTNHSYLRDLVRYSGVFTLCVYVNGNCVYTYNIVNCRVKFEEGSKNSTGFYNAVWIATWVPISISAYFFCDKDDQITWNVLYRASYGEVATNKGGNRIPGQNFNFRINSVTIY